MWNDRVAAGDELGCELVARGYGGREDTIVLGIPRGGVEVGARVAETLGAPLDVVVVRKVGMPGNPEFAAGAVDPDGRVLANPSAGTSEVYLREAAEKERLEALRRLEAYRGPRPEPQLARRCAIVVDDGIATGLTAHAAVAFLRGRGADDVVLAVPVMAPSAVRYLQPLVDELVVLQAPPGFYAVGAYYRRFPQLNDGQVVALLAASG